MSDSTDDLDDANYRVGRPNISGQPLSSQKIYRGGHTSPSNTELREAIKRHVKFISGLSPHNLHRGEEALAELIQAHEQQLLTELLGAAVEVNTVQYSYVNGDKMVAGFTNSAVPVSVIQRLQNKTNDGGS